MSDEPKIPGQRKPGQKGGHGGQAENRITKAAADAKRGEAKKDSCVVIGLAALGFAGALNAAASFGWI